MLQGEIFIMDFSNYLLSNKIIQGKCRRSGKHPCGVDSQQLSVHPCCCGDCNFAKVIFCFYEAQS